MTREEVHAAEAKALALRRRVNTLKAEAGVKRASAHAAEVELAHAEQDLTAAEAEAERVQRAFETREEAIRRAGV